MPVTIERQTFYTKAELDALIADANKSVKTNWSKTTVTYENGYTYGWPIQAFFKNAHTKAVTGILPIQGITADKMKTSKYVGYLPSAYKYNTGMLIRYCGEWVYGTPSADSTWAAFSIHDTNTRLTNGVNGDDNMHFYLQGESGDYVASDTTKGNPATLIENWYYLAHDAKIVTTEPHITYLSEGAFYDQDTVDLYTGRAWLKKEFTFNNGELSGYGGVDGNGITNSKIAYFKNLWSGEVIFQYSLYPSNTSVFPTIPKPARFAPRKSIYIKPRYISSHTACTDIKRMRSTNFRVFRGDTATGYGVAPFVGCTWITGSNYWIGDIESPDGNRTETNPLWHHDSATAIPSINTSSYSNIGNPAHNNIVATYNNHQNHDYWNDASDDSSIAHEDKLLPENLGTEGTHVLGCRSGMLFNYIDCSPTALNCAAANTFATNYIEVRYASDYYTPHTGYNCGTSENQPIYYMGLVYEGTIDTTKNVINANGTYTGFGDIFTPNVYMYQTPPASLAEGNIHGFGTHGGLNHVANNRIIFTGHILSNQP